MRFGIRLGFVLDFFLALLEEVMESTDYVPVSFCLDD